MMTRQRLDYRHYGTAFQPTEEARCLISDHLFGLYDRFAADRQACPDNLLKVIDRVQEHVIEAALSGSTSRGMPRSAMNTGACLRRFTTLSSRPLPMMGSVLAVLVTTISNS